MARASGREGQSANATGTALRLGDRLPYFTVVLVRSNYTLQRTYAAGYIITVVSTRYNYIKGRPIEPPRSLRLRFYAIADHFITSVQGRIPTHTP